MTCRKPVVYICGSLFTAALVLTIVLAATGNRWNLSAPIALFLAVMTGALAASGEFGDDQQQSSSGLVPIELPGV